jgi:hypothetical protein
MRLHCSDQFDRPVEGKRIERRSIERYSVSTLNENNQLMKYTSRFIAAASVAAFVLVTPMGLLAASKKKAAAAASPSPAESASPTAAALPARPIPFRGMVSEVDKSGKTFSIAGKKTRVFKVTDKTVITKNGAPATLTDLAANEKVTGSYWKGADGSLEAKTVKIGGPEADEKKATKSKKSASPAPESSPHS